VLPIRTRTRIVDIATGEELPAQIVSKRAEGAWWVLEGKGYPCNGIQALKIELPGFMPEMMRKEIRGA